MARDGERANFVSGEVVCVECLSCGRARSLGRDEGIVPGLPLVQLTRRLKCSSCGSRAVRAARARSPRDIARFLRDRMDRSQGQG